MAALIHIVKRSNSYPNTKAPSRLLVDKSKVKFKLAKTRV